MKGSASSSPRSRAFSAAALGSHPDVRARLRIGADQEPEGPEVMEAVLDQPVARDGEVGRGDVEGPGDAPIEQALQRVGEAMVNIVDNKGDRHGLGSSLFGRVRFGLRAGFADAIDFDHATIFSASALHLCRKAVSGELLEQADLLDGRLQVEPSLAVEDDGCGDLELIDISPIELPRERFELGHLAGRAGAPRAGFVLEELSPGSLGQ